MAGIGKPRRHKARRSKAGFSLIEMLVALAILALIAGIAGPKAISFLSRSKVKTAELQIQELETALELYYLDIGRYPSEADGLQALVTSPPTEKYWNGPYLETEASLKDPWDRWYLYRSPGQTGDFDIYSLGRDGTEGGTGEDRDIPAS
ncbi:type II secretion system major pseudopilin GspG [Labrenzia sp. PHM005]|uniref:type II secretion system major pseudopilin GspG n=1 Tax=Labrenzia sp. PHM005 TaxID=2590016 RepID=UPI0011408460|nr:type II secretion system major pseudopilin GspG [Labrenzia sp. PHM005]QDG74407.1 type II secretion system protein GspG [Labrenzia sp. PHM005]